LHAAKKKNRAEDYTIRGNVDGKKNSKAKRIGSGRMARMDGQGQRSKANGAGGRRTGG